MKKPAGKWLTALSRNGDGYVIPPAMYNWKVVSFAIGYIKSGTVIRQFCSSCDSWHWMLSGPPVSCPTKTDMIIHTLQQPRPKQRKRTRKETK